MQNVLEYSTVPVVSSDIIGNPHSSIFDSLMTQAKGDGYCRVLSWYDNEWGYSNRCVDLITLMSRFGDCPPPATIWTLERDSADTSSH